MATTNRVKITYDPAKDAANLKSRSLSFDQAKDYGERRFRVFGYIGEQLYALVFTPRGDAVHVISFRKANGREMKRYG